MRGPKRSKIDVVAPKEEEGLRGRETERSLARPRRRWDNIKIDVQKVEWGSMDCIDLAQDRDRWRALVNAIMNLRVPYNVGKFLSI